MGPDAVPKSLARFFKRQNIYINKSIQIYSGRKKKKKKEGNSMQKVLEGT